MFEDIAGIKLTPGNNGEDCAGNGEISHKRVEDHTVLSGSFSPKLC